MFYDSQAIRRARVGWLLAAICAVLVSTTAHAQMNAFERASREGMPVTVAGTLTALVGDDLEGVRSDTFYFIRDEQTGRPFWVRFDQDAAALRPGARVTLTGKALDSELYVTVQGVEDVNRTSTRLQATQATTRSVTGDRRSLVMVSNFADAAVTCSVGAVRDIMFTDPNGRSVAALYRDNSRGQLSLSGEVVGTFNLTARSTDSCDLSGWAQQADAAATASGVDVSQYGHRVYVMPDNSCVATGYATMGGSPARAWVFSCDVQGVYAHEVGHTLGMDHASDPSSEFGDWTDPMGMSTTQVRGLNAPHRHQLGWLAADRLVTVTQTGYYDVAPLAIDPSTATAPQVIRIQKPDTGEYYYLSYRTASGFDQSISGWYHGRLSVHRYKGDGSPSRTSLLAGLTDGQTYVDQTNGITLTMISHAVTHATVRVEFAAACPAATPSVSLSPQAQNGAAGANATYAMSITNIDGASCPPSTLTFTPSLPGGWAGQVSPSSLTMGAGTTATASLTVQVPANASAGTYNVSLDINDATTPLHGTRTSGSYTILGDAIPPSAPSGLTATANQKSKQIELSWNPSQDNVGVVAYEIVRNGGAVGNSKATKWADSTWIAGATYTYSIVALDQAGNKSPPSNSATVKLNGGDSGTGGSGGGSSGGSGGNGGGKPPK